MRTVDDLVVLRHHGENGSPCTGDDFVAFCSTPV